MIRILLLTDFSEAANNAIDYAIQLWADVDCKFHLMHVVSSSTYTTESLLASAENEDLYSSLLKKTKGQLKKTFEALKAKNNNPKHSFKCHLDHDVFLDAIKQLIKKESIDYVVMGSNGASNVKEKLFGTHALNVMRSLPYNVVVIPDQLQFQAIEKVLLLLNADDSLNHKNLNGINQFLEVLEAELHILSVNPRDASNDRWIEKSLSTLKSHNKVYDVPLEHAASTYVQTNGISMVLMIGEMSGFIDRLLGKQGKSNLSKLYKTPLSLIRG